MCPWRQIEEQIRKSSPAEYKAIETKLLAVLKAPETPKDAKRYICRWLTVVGSPDCVPAVAPLLTDDDLSSMARMALEPMASPAAGAALRDALPKVHGRLLAGLIGSIGVRRDPEAVSFLAGAAKDDDPVVAGAALLALGAIGTESAAQTLAGLQVAPALSRAQARARITAAWHLEEFRRESPGRLHLPRPDAARPAAVHPDRGLERTDRRAGAGRGGQTGDRDGAGRRRRHA